MKYYRASAYNDHGVLGVPWLLSLVMVYLSRHVVLVLVAGFSSFMMRRLGTGNADFSAFYGQPRFLLASLPALAVLVVALRRSPASGRLTRHIWQHGRSLLLGAALLDLALLAFSTLQGRLAVDELLIISALLDGYVVAYLLRSTRVRDTFAEFPSATD